MNGVRATVPWCRLLYCFSSPRYSHESTPLSRSIITFCLQRYTSTFIRSLVPDNDRKMNQVILYFTLLPLYLKILSKFFIKKIFYTKYSYFKSIIKFKKIILFLYSRSLIFFFCVVKRNYNSARINFKTSWLI